MGYSYNKLWKLLIDNKTNKEELRKRTGISSEYFNYFGKVD